MKNLFLVFIIGCAISAYGCGGKIEEAQNALQNLSTIATSAKESVEKLDRIQELRESRRARGDTLAMDMDALAEFLPASLSGYTAGEPENSSTEVPGMSMSQAKREYIDREGHALTITLTDWNSSEVGWAGVYALFSLRMKSENSNQAWATFQEGDFVSGHQHFDKKTRRSVVQYALGGRFHLTIEADNRDVDFVKGVAVKMNVDKLSKM